MSCLFAVYNDIRNLNQEVNRVHGYTRLLVRLTFLCKQHDFLAEGSSALIYNPAQTLYLVCQDHTLSNTDLCSSREE